jgi:hypothetical protein
MQALRTEQLNTETLTALADNADNTVYGYAYDVPETTLDPATQVALFKDIVAAFDAYCVDEPTLCDEGLREKVLGTSPSSPTRLFQRLYPKVFAAVTYRALSAAMEERLDKTRKINMYMLAERLYGEGDDDERAARAMCAGMRISMRDTNDDDVKDGVQLDAALSSSTSTSTPTPTLTPLDRRELGETTVHQGRRF